MLSNNPTEKELIEEIERCKNPVYFYNTYITINGVKPPPITQEQYNEMVNRYQTRHLVIAINIKARGK